MSTISKPYISTAINTRDKVDHKGVIELYIPSSRTKTSVHLLLTLYRQLSKFQLQAARYANLLPHLLFIPLLLNTRAIEQWHTAYYYEATSLWDWSI